MSGQDILDQAAGTTPFVQNYLHIDWDGTEVQNDKADRRPCTASTGNPVTDGIGAVPIDHSRPRCELRGPDHADRAGDAGVHRRQPPATDALTVADGAYKV